MKPGLVLSIALILAGLSCAHAQSFLQEEMPFSRARRLLLKNGWTALDLRPQNLEVGTQERTLTKKGIREVDICSMDAGALCNLFYKKNQTCLRLTTRGERLSSMRVFSWKAAPACQNISKPIPWRNQGKR